MEKNTAPDPDHIPIEFFQACWTLVKADILSLFFEILEHHLNIGRVNYGTISLIPKIKSNKIQQFRPICLLNVIYKIFTKTLKLRLDDILERIINKSQTTFLKHRK